jgi:hypothetical protein
MATGIFFTEMRALLRYAVCVLVSFLASAYAISASPIALFTFPLNFSAPGQDLTVVNRWGDFQFYLFMRFLPVALSLTV